MIFGLGTIRKKQFFKIISLIIFISFSLNFTIPKSCAQIAPLLASEVGFQAFVPPILKGIKVDLNKPFNFDFVLDSGNSSLAISDQRLKEESTKLIKYFLASLAIPENDLWVNLNPKEPNRIVPNEFGTTEMGRDLLVQDYILKQITASLMNPEGEVGKVFWQKIYKQTYEKYGTTEIPVDALNKVWIVPSKAVVYENSAKDAEQATVFVVEAKLKVLLEDEYVSVARDSSLGASKQQKPVTSDKLLARDIIKQIIIPVLEKEVNEGKNFSQLRQIYYSLILARWYKETLKQSILNQEYSDQGKVAGIDLANKNDKLIIYNQYLEAFQKGAFDYIKEDYDASIKKVIPRKYFSGGVNLSVRIIRTQDKAIVSDENKMMAGKAMEIKGLLKSPRAFYGFSLKQIKRFCALIKHPLIFMSLFFLYSSPVHVDEGINNKNFFVQDSLVSFNRVVKTQPETLEDVKKKIDLLFAEGYFKKEEFVKIIKQIKNKHFAKELLFYISEKSFHVILLLGKEYADEPYFEDVFKDGLEKGFNSTLLLQQHPFLKNKQKTVVEYLSILEKLFLEFVDRRDSLYPNEFLGSYWEVSSSFKEDIGELEEYKVILFMIMQIAVVKPEIVKDGSVSDEIRNISENVLANNFPHFRIYIHPYVKNVLKQEGLTNVEKYSISLSSYRLLKRLNLEFNGMSKDLNDINIQKAVDFILKKRKEFSQRIIFAKDRPVLSITFFPEIDGVISSEDSVMWANFDQKYIEDKVGVEVDSVTSFYGDDLKDRILRTIEEGKGSLTIYINAHGTEKELYLNSNEILEEEVLTNSLLKRGDLKEVNILFDSCYSYQYAQHLINDLIKQGSKELPVILVLSNKNQLVYERWVFNPAKKTVLLMQDMFDLENLQIEVENDPAVFIPLTSQEEFDLRRGIEAEQENNGFFKEEDDFMKKKNLDYIEISSNLLDLSVTEDVLFSSNDLKKNTRDTAMLTDRRNRLEDSSIHAPGGIDFNLDRIELEAQGESGAFNLPTTSGALKNVQINGLYPVIIEIVPIVNLPLFLGVN